MCKCRKYIYLFNNLLWRWVLNLPNISTASKIFICSFSFDLIFHLSALFCTEKPKHVRNKPVHQGAPWCTIYTIYNRNILGLVPAGDLSSGRRSLLHVVPPLSPLRVLLLYYCTVYHRKAKMTNKYIFKKILASSLYAHTPTQKHTHRHTQSISPSSLSV